jgi:ACS family tartrate transporter-like MFS transporter
VLATIGIMGLKGPFWTLPSAYLTGAGAAAGIAFINSVGSLGGFFGPWIVGLAKQTTNSFSGGLYALAAVAVGGGIITLIAIRVKPAAGVVPKTPAETADVVGTP